MDREGHRELDLTTLAISEQLCRERVELNDKMLRNTEWLAQHPFTGIRQVRIETKDGD